MDYYFVFNNPCYVKKFRIEDLRTYLVLTILVLLSRIHSQLKLHVFQIFLGASLYSMRFNVSIAWCVSVLRAVEVIMSDGLKTKLQYPKILLENQISILL